MQKCIDMQGFKVVCSNAAITVPEVVSLINTTFNLNFNVPGHRQALARLHGSTIEIGYKAAFFIIQH